MASKNLTFDPSAGVPYAANLSLYTGTDFKTTFTVVDTSDVAFDFQGLTTTSVWTGSAQMQKSAGVAATTVAAGTFSVGLQVLVVVYLTSLWGQQQLQVFQKEDMNIMF